LMLFDKFGVGEGDWVLDPFCGVGTTLLSARERGLNSVGVDVSPLFAFVSQAKLQDYDPEELKGASRDLFSRKFVRPDLKGVDPLVRRAFSKYALEDILFFRALIEGIGEPAIRGFFTLALMNAAAKSSYVIKDGAVLRFHKRPVPPFRKFYRRVVKVMIRQLGEIGLKDSQAVVKVGDARRLDFLEDGCFDAIITSPPYLNKIEYTTVYSIEHSLFLGPTRIDPVRSYIGLDVKDVDGILPEHNLPEIAKAYFHDMDVALGEMHRVLRGGGRVAIVVAGGVFKDRVIESDLLLAELAEAIGFKVDEMWAVNRRVATSGRTKIGEARESVLMMRK